MAYSYENLSSQEQLIKKLKFLKKSLDRTNIKINESKGHNMQLFTKISEIRKERVIYDNIYQDLEIEYMKAKEDLIQTILTQNDVLKTQELTIE